MADSPKSSMNRRLAIASLDGKCSALTSDCVVSIKWLTTKRMLSLFSDFCILLSKLSLPGKMYFLHALTTLSLIAFSHAAAVIQGNCTSSDSALNWLSHHLSSASAISCLGSPLQQHNAGRYWGSQFGKNASVVVYPGSTQDVSYTVQAANRSPLGADFAIVGGAHSQINASSAYGFVVDLSWMNKTHIVHNFPSSNGSSITAIQYEGGANWGQVQTAVNGSGCTPVGARVANVGAGGFSLGGGIGFLAGAYGYAVDRLVQLEVVLPSDGRIVTATRNNSYNDLFWAFQGGSGQFGIVTRFWQEAAPEPQASTIGFYYINDEDVDRLRNNTVDFFEHNDDPFSVVYYSFGFLPSSLVDPVPPPSSYASRTLLIALHFGDPTNANQKGYNETFAGVLSGINTTNSVVQTTPYYADLVEIGGAAYPYGFRRGFYGPQTTKISVDYLTNLTDTMNAYISALQARGEHPYSASFVMQYMYPGLNGHLPPSDEATAWPHSVAGHQTLFTPAYLNATDDDLTLQYTDLINQVTYDRQKQLGEFLGDYPNYISPGVSGHRVWGENVKRLQQVKQKYDPGCLIRNGRVFASYGCIEGGWANVFAE